MSILPRRGECITCGHDWDKPDCWHIAIGQLDQFVIEADKMRVQLRERIEDLEQQALEDYSEWLNIAHDLGAADGVDMRVFIQAQIRQAIEAIRLLLPLAQAYRKANPSKIYGDVIDFAERYLASLRMNNDPGNG